MPEILLGVCWSRNFCPTVTGTSSTCTLRTVFRNLQCFWISQPVKYRLGTHDNDPGHNSPKVDARLELIHIFAASTKVCLCADVTVVDVEHTLKRKARSECLQAFCIRSLPAGCWCRLSKHYSHRWQLSGKRQCAPWAEVWMESIVTKYFEDHRVGLFQISYDIT